MTGDMVKKPRKVSWETPEKNTDYTKKSRTTTSYASVVTSFYGYVC